MTAKSEETLLPPPWVLSLMGLAALAWLLYRLKELVVLLVLGYAIAFAMDPLLSLFERRKISRPLGFFVISGSLIVFLSILFLTAIPTLLDEYTVLSANLPEYLRIAEEKLRVGAISFQGRLPEKFSKIIQEGELINSSMSVSGETINQILAGLGSALLKGYSITMTVVNLFLLPFIAFYLAVDFKDVHLKILALCPNKYRAEIKELATRIHRLLSAYVKGQLMVGTILFALYALGFSIAGLKLWFLLAVISGFGNIIPYFGFLIGIVLSSIMALVTFGDLSHLLIIWSIYGAVQLLEGFVITPTIMGKEVGFSPLLIILALFIGGSLFGLLGVFLAIPGAAILKVLIGWLHEEILSHIDGADAKAS